MNVEFIPALLVGIGLSAACGFRVFVPLLLASLAHRFGYLSLGPQFQWLGSDVALVIFAVATVVEVAAYYIPWVDNALDTITTPAAMVAGTVLTVALLEDLNPVWKWTLGLVAGGGIAGLVGSATTFGRASSSLTTGGLANPVFATGELVAALATALLAILLPIAAAILVAAILVWAVWRLLARRRKPDTVSA